MYNNVFLWYISQLDRSNRILSLDWLFLITRIRIVLNCGNVPTTRGFAGGSFKSCFFLSFIFRNKENKNMAVKRCGIFRYKITFCASIFNYLPPMFCVVLVIRQAMITITFVTTNYTRLRWRKQSSNFLQCRPTNWAACIHIFF